MPNKPRRIGRPETISRNLKISAVRMSLRVGVDEAQAPCRGPGLGKSSQLQAISWYAEGRRHAGDVDSVSRRKPARDEPVSAVGAGVSADPGESDAAAVFRDAHADHVLSADNLRVPQN
jgi:hypothetical protein